MMTPLYAPLHIPNGADRWALLISVVMDKLPERVNGFGQMAAKFNVK
jgi:hypothetical protein